MLKDWVNLPFCKATVRCLGTPAVGDASRSRGNVSPTVRSRAKRVIYSSSSSDDEERYVPFRRVHPEDEQDWRIDAIMFGDGFKHSTKTLKKDQWYGCANTHGGPESFYRLDAFTFNIRERQSRASSFLTKSITPQEAPFPRSCIIPSVRITCSEYQKMRANVNAEAIENFCRRYSGFAVVIGGPGARAVNPDFRPYFVRDKPSLVAFSSEFDCAPAATINGITALKGLDGYLRAKRLWVQHRHHLTTLGEAGPVITRMGSRLSLRKPKHLTASLQNGCFDQSFSIAAGFKRGVWIVRLVQHGVHWADHCVTVVAGQGVILDSEEQFPIQLSPQSLRVCGGPNCWRLEIAQVMELASI